MRGGAALAAVFALALVSCRQEPTFEERYDAAHERIEGMARDIDADLKQAQPTDAAGDAAGTLPPADDDESGPPAP